MIKPYFLLCFALCLLKYSFSQCNFTVDIDVFHPQCYGTATGNITLIIDGTSGPWIPTITDVNGDIKNIPGLPNLNNYLAGWYYISVIDSSGCEVLDSVELINPPEIDISSQVISQTCGHEPLGEIHIDSIHNTNGYVYVYWNPDPNGINGSNQFENIGLIAGTYEVHIIDSIGCTKEFDFTISSPSNMSFTDLGSTIHSAANPGEVYCSVSGGVGTYTYTWTSLTDQSTSNDSVWTNLMPGDYSIQVEDSLGCILSDTIFIGSLSNEQFTSNPDIKVYPTLVNDGQVSVVNNLSPESVFISIYSINGKLAHHQQLILGSQTINLDLADGPYYYLINDNQNTVIARDKLIVTD